jgi:myosin-1
VRQSSANRSRIEYNKKPGKLATVKVVKDASQGDSYKSGTIHTGSGEPPNSVSKPTPRGKQVAARPVTKGKLLRPGGPGGGPSKLASRPAADRRPVPQPTPAPRPTPAAQQAAAPRPVAQPVADLAAAHQRTSSTASARTPPPPPPATAPGPKKAKVLYDFNSDNSSMLSIKAGELVQIMSKEGNGKAFAIVICLHVQTNSFQVGGYA